MLEINAPVYIVRRSWRAVEIISGTLIAKVEDRTGKYLEVEHDGPIGHGATSRQSAEEVFEWATEAEHAALRLILEIAEEKRYTKIPVGHLHSYATWENGRACIGSVPVPPSARAELMAMGLIAEDEDGSIYLTDLGIAKVRDCHYRGDK